MALNDIELSPQLLQELYENTVFPVGKTSPDAAVKTVSERMKTGIEKPNVPPRRGHLGENKQQILALVSHPSHPFLPDKELALLTGILGACRLGLADIALCNTAANDFDLERVKKELKPKVILGFGIEQSLTDLPLRIPLYQAQAHGGRQFIFSAPLGELEHDREQKRQLWEGLKKLFSLA